MVGACFASTVNVVGLRDVNGVLRSLDHGDMISQSRLAALSTILSVCWTCGSFCTSESQAPVVHHNGHVRQLRLRYLGSLGIVFHTDDACGTCLILRSRDIDHSVCVLPQWNLESFEPGVCSASASGQGFRRSCR